MYSGTTLRRGSGDIIGAHQKIDRVARRQLKALLADDSDFPRIREILHFEGHNGPDGIKRKSPARDEPWHYIDPHNPEEGELLSLIDDHLVNLTNALAEDNRERAAFEAAWLAHAITDGLTPAHHYPLEAKLEEIRGEGLETRTSFRSKVLLPGETSRQIIKNNWEIWGAKGVMTTHFMFELGVATTIATLRMNYARPSADQRIRVEKQGIDTLFMDSLHHINHLQMHETFHKKGWTRQLARQTKMELAPTIVRTVTLAWYYAYYRAEQKKKRRRS